MWMKNKKGWIRIVEAFVAILLIAGVLLMIIDSGSINRNDMSSQIYDVEISILKEIQLDNVLREEILSLSDGDLPVNWRDANFPANVKIKLEDRIPNYLDCEASICDTSDDCIVEYLDKDVYAQSVMISSLSDYRMLKLFCWMI